MLVGPRLRKSPFFAACRARGMDTYSVYNHTYMPIFFESAIADYTTLVDSVSLWDVACQRQVEIVGPDAAAFVQYLTPRPVADCGIGQCKYVLLCDEAGGIVNDPVLIRLAHDHFWLSLADSDVLLWARGLNAEGQWRVSIREPDVSPLQLQGPRAADVARTIFGERIDTLKYYWGFETLIDGYIPVVVTRTGWSNEKGFEVYLRDSKYGTELFERIMGAGEKFGIKPGAPNAIRRVEAGLLSYGADASIHHNPYQYPHLQRICAPELVDEDMECLSRAALLDMADKRESFAQFVGFNVRDAVGQETNFGATDSVLPIMTEHSTCGELTIAIHSPRLDRTIGLGFLDPSVWNPYAANADTKAVPSLTVDYAGQNLLLTPCHLPHISSPKARVA